MENKNNNVYIVDDEPDILELISCSLQKSGFSSQTFTNAKDFFDALQKDFPNLIILDLMLGDHDGFEVCKKLKSIPDYANIPIIILSAKSNLIDKVLGLELGADDYVTKPFYPEELISRIKAILRRKKNKIQENIRIISNNFYIDLHKFEVYLENEKIELTTTEFKILDLLSKNIGWVYSRNDILDYLWGNDKIVIDRTIDVHIKNLREKLGKKKNYIQNVRGIGYKIKK